MEAQIEITEGQSNKTDVPDNNVGDIDCISRKAVLDAIDSKAWEFCDYLISKGRNDEQKPVSHFADNLRECVSEDLPSVTTQLSSELDKNSKKLEKDFGESDCISRTRAIERLKLNLPISQGADNSRDRHRYMQAMADIQAIKELPSLTPQGAKT